MPTFSLILCTVGRRDEIGAFLDSLLRQGDRAADCQVLVVDQNGDDRLVSLLAAYAGRLAVTHLPTDTRGLSRARNVGLRHAAGDLVGFPDDDCQYPAGYLDRVAAAFDDPDTDAITGHPTVDPHAELATDWQAGRRTLDRVSVMNRCQEFTIFVRRRSLGTVRFNDRLGVGAGTPWGSDEGPDFLVRLVDAGRTVAYYPRLLVYHPEKVARITRATLARAASYARGRGAFFRLNRYPRPVVANALFRAVAGCGVKLVQLQPMRSAYYLTIAAGIARGLCMTRREAAELSADVTPDVPANGGVHANG